tara:strand:+ start:1049 stop:1945 length:897 start_codon:yes stop_codon:yes gene_type:complete
MNELTHQELLDFADLDVLGLLDEVDTTRFENAFQKATPADQDLIRERQAEFATQLVDTSNELSPPEQLKARVLESIQTENDAIDSALAPVARIGIGRWRREQIGGTLVQPADESHLEESGDPTQMRRLQRSSAIWRAASFGLIAGLAVSLLIGYSMVESAREATRLASQRAASEQLSELYPQNLGSVINNFKRDQVLGLATSFAHRGSITAILNTEENNVRLMVFAIKAGDYSISYTDDAENEHRLGFKVDEGMTVVEMASLDQGVARALSSRKWVVRDSNNSVVAVCNPGIASIQVT